MLRQPLVLLDVGLDGCAYECRERGDVFCSIDDFKVIRGEFLERDATLSYIEKTDVVRSNDKVCRRTRLAVLDVDTVGRRKDHEGLIFDEQTYRQVWTILDSVECDS